MSSSYKKIILVTDGTAKSKSAEDTAANIAVASGAVLRIIDTLNPPSLFSSWVDGGATGAFGKLVEYKMASLDQIADRFRKLGVTVEVAVLEGNSSQQIAADAKSTDADLVIRYNRFIDAPPGGPAIAVSMHPPRGGSDRRRFKARPVTDMTIAGNCFSRTRNVPISMHNVDGLRVCGNSIDWPSDDSDWIYHQDCSTVAIENNMPPRPPGNGAGEDGSRAASP